MSTLPKLVTSAAAVIADWKLVAVSIDDSGFRDNGVAVFENELVRLRVESEQGNPLLEVASRQEPENWFDVSLLLNLARGNSLTTLNDFGSLVVFAAAERDAIVRSLTVDFGATKARLAQAETARFRAMFPGVEIG